MNRKRTSVRMPCDCSSFYVFQCNNNKNVVNCVPLVSGDRFVAFRAIDATENDRYKKIPK